MKTFEQYHKDNPQIWEAFEKRAFTVIEKGFKNYSSKSIFEDIRWHTKVSATDDEFKANNTYTSDYSRKFMETYPSYDGFFRTRSKKQ